MEKAQTIIKSTMVFVWVAVIISTLIFAFQNSWSYQDLQEIIRSQFLLVVNSEWSYFLPFLFILLFTARPLFLIPAWVMNVVAYYSFGLWYGYFLVIISEQFSAGLLFLFVKYLSGDKFKDNILSSAEKFGIDIHSSVDKNFYTVFILRLASLPFDYVTAFCAFVDIKIKPFLFATFLVSLVWAGLFFVTFDSFDSGFFEEGILNTGIFILFLIFSYFIARRSGVLKNKMVK